MSLSMNTLRAVMQTRLDIIHRSTAHLDNVQGHLLDELDTLRVLKGTLRKSCREAVRSIPNHKTTTLSASTQNLLQGTFGMSSRKVLRNIRKQQTAGLRRKLHEVIQRITQIRRAFDKNLKQVRMFVCEMGELQRDLLVLGL